MSREPPVPSTHDGTTVTRGRPIIVVDDEPAILELMCDVLESEGFSVLTASSAAAALKLLKHAPAALIITDLMMPQINGIEFARRLQADPRTAAIPVVLMSAAMPAGPNSMFAAVIHKPFAITRIVEVVRQCLPA